MSPLPPLQREVLVAGGAVRAFEVFTAGIGAWWPIATHGVYGEGASVAFVDGQLVESAPGQPDTTWGTITSWDPPHELSFTWHPGAGEERASQVTVRFEPRGEETLVRLQHAGWERLADPAAARDEYAQGWPGVLDRYREAAEEETWVVLLHRPADGEGPAVFGDPRFAEHRAFLDRLAETGSLVAAGPLGDEPGAGMAVLRLPGAGRLIQATVLAQSDASVRAGLFTVEVRPWEVVLSTI